MWNFLANTSSQLFLILIINLLYIYRHTHSRVSFKTYIYNAEAALIVKSNLPRSLNAFIYIIYFGLHYFNLFQRL